MICPYCNNKMEEGYINSSHELNWKKGDKKYSQGYSVNYDYNDSVLLGSFSFLKGTAVKAYCCRNCTKIIIDYSERTE